MIALSPEYTPTHAGSSTFDTPRSHRHQGFDARQRAERLLGCEIDFIDNPEFRVALHDDSLAAEILDFSVSDFEADALATNLPDLPPHLAALCETRLLSADEERAMFRKMNFLKFRANSRRSALNPDMLDVVALEAAENDLDEASRVRDLIVRANMRLVISIVKKYVTPQVSFDDLLSEGIETMMHAVEKFDFHRGFRFSTYTYRSVARHAFRVVGDRQREFSRFVTGADSVDFEESEAGGSSSLNDRAWSNLRGLMSKLIEHLDRREQFIIRSRYALGAHRKVRSFQCLADKLGISKERVRQLESRAVNKLRTMAAQYDPDNMFETLALR